MWDINHFAAKLNKLNFRPLEAVSHYNDPQFQVELLIFV